jgi:hypothetical protein
MVGGKHRRESSLCLILLCFGRLASGQKADLAGEARALVQDEERYVGSSVRDLLPADLIQERLPWTLCGYSDTSSQFSVGGRFFNAGAFLELGADALLILNV